VAGQRAAASKAELGVKLDQKRKLDFMMDFDIRNPIYSYSEKITLLLKCH